VLDRAPVDQVIIALPVEDPAGAEGADELLALRTVDVKVVPDLYQYITLGGGLRSSAGCRSSASREVRSTAGTWWPSAPSTLLFTGWRCCWPGL